jgi:hypothetical protein
VPAILDAARDAAGRLVHTDVVGLLVDASQAEEFWFDMVSPRLYSTLTSTHSASVAESAVQIARRFGLGELDVRLLGIAGVTHDLGKLAIPNAILDKPERLTEAEMQVMQQHSYFTYTILRSIEGFGQIADWAGGSGRLPTGPGCTMRSSTAPATRFTSPMSGSPPVRGSSPWPTSSPHWSRTGPTVPVSIASACRRSCAMR